jgi:hypothetical protein
MQEPVDVLQEKVILRDARSCDSQRPNGRRRLILCGQPIGPRVPADEHPLTRGDHDVLDGPIWLEEPHPNLGILHSPDLSRQAAVGQAGRANLCARHP